MSQKKGGNDYVEMIYFFRVKCKFLKKRRRDRGMAKEKKGKRERKKEKFSLDYIYPLYTMEIMITGKFADISE